MPVGRPAIVAIACASALVWACSLGLDGYSSSSGGSGDAGPSDGGAPVDGEPGADGAADGGKDAADAAPACDLAAPFGAPAPISSLNTTANDELWPRLLPDELTMVLATSRPPNGYGLYMTKRSSVDGAWNTPQYLANVNKPGAFDADPMISADGLTFFFQSDRSGNRELYWSKRMTLIDDFPLPSAIPGLDTTAEEIQPFLTADATEIYFARSIDAGYDQIHRAPAVGTAFGTVEQVAPLQSSASDWLPTPSADRLTIYFASLRSPTKGDYDIWVSHRASVNDPWNTPQPVDELNSPDLDAPGWLSVDGCRLYFHSRRGGMAMQDLFVAEKPR